MENTKHIKYENAIKHVKKIKDFYKHIIIYVIVNIFLLVAKRRIVLFALNETPNAEEGFINWIHVNIISTPDIWGIILIIHGISVYRYKFPFFKNWEERKIKEFMSEDSSEESKQWE